MTDPAATDPFAADATANDPFASDPFAADPFAADAAAAVAAPPAPSVGGFGAQVIGGESRREQRVRVSWPARVQLAGGRIVEMRARDLSENGIGLVSPMPLPVNQPLMFALGSPDPDDLKRIVPVTGHLRVVYVVLQQGDYQVGAVWEELADEQRERISRWVKRQRR